MNIRGRYINNNEHFLCEKGDIKELFLEYAIDIEFNKKTLSETGKLKNKKFSYKNSPNYNKDKFPNLVCSLSFWKWKKIRINIDLYPINIEDYNERLHNEFVKNILPKLCQIYFPKGKEMLKVYERYCVDIKLIKNNFIFIERFN